MQINVKQDVKIGIVGATPRQATPDQRECKCTFPIAIASSDSRKCLNKLFFSCRFSHCARARQNTKQKTAHNDIKVG